MKTSSAGIIMIKSGISLSVLQMISTKYMERSSPKTIALPDSYIYNSSVLILNPQQNSCLCQSDCKCTRTL